MKQKRKPQTGAGKIGAATIREVAAEAGVSTATVSRVLAGADNVSEAVQNRVLLAVRKLDYHPNHLARDLRAGLRKVVGVIIPDLQNPFLTGVVHGVETVLYEAGYTLMLGHSDGLIKREQNHLAVLRSEGAAGLILIPSNGPGASYSQLRTWDIPVVAVDRAPNGLQVDLAVSNNREGVREAVAHLVSHGYKNIAFINGPEGLSVTRERLDGYLQALTQAGIPAQNALVVNSDFRQAGGQAAMAQLLNSPRLPRAVVVANNLMTLGALHAVHQRGVRIPDDIAMVGFDDMPWAMSLRPPMTVVAQPAEELGIAAAQLLLERLQDRQRIVRQVILPTRLMVRASCGCRTQAGADQTKAAEGSKKPGSE